MPYEGGSSSNGTAERIIPIHMEPRSPIRTPTSRTASTNGTATPPNGAATTPSGAATPRSACPERIIPIFREGTPPATANGSAAAVKRQQVPTVIGFKHSYFSPISSNSNSDRHSGTAAKPIVVRKLSPLSPKHIVGPVGSNGVKPAPPLKPEHLKSPPMSPVPSEEAAYSGSNRSSPLQLLPLQRSSSSLPAAADTESGTALTSPEEEEDREVTFPSIASAKETDSLRTSAPEDLEDTIVCEPPPESDMPEAESLPPAAAAEDSEPASLVTENLEPVSLSEEADQLPVPVHQQNGHFVELLPDEQER
jgi:hypothetical protein